MDIDSITKGIQDSIYDMETESRLARVGLKETQDMASVMNKYEWLFEPRTVAYAKSEYDKEDDPTRKEKLRRVYHYLLDGYMYRKVAGIDDEVTTMQLQAEVEVDGEKIAYHNIRPIMSREPDFARRERLSDASLEVVERSNPYLTEMLKVSLDTLQNEFGYKSYTAYFSERKGVDYARLRERLHQFLDATKDVYWSNMGTWTEALTNHGLGTLRSAHVGYITRMGEYDRYFPKAGVVAVGSQALAGLGFDLSKQPIHVDAEEREKKNPRAVCYAPNPPFEVHLIIKPIGGRQDYAAFLHEGGHAEHYANEDPNLDYVFRNVSVSHALTEIYSFLMEFTTLDSLWLERYLGLTPQIAGEIAYYSRLTELFMLRRYVAKLTYELEFFEDPLNDQRNRKLYQERLTAATGFEYPQPGFMDDMDEGFYSADYLRAWISEAMVRDYLKRTYGKEWFANPQAGEFLKSLWSKGVSIDNEDVIRQIGYEPFDTSCLAGQFLGDGLRRAPATK